MTLVVGLSGKARHGKGSIVQLTQIDLQKGDNEFEVRAVSFATKLKAMAADLSLWANDESGFNEYLLRAGMSPTAENVEVAKTLRQLALKVTLDDLKAKTPDARTYLQYIGTETFRVHVEDLYWVNAAFKTISALPEGTQLVFVPDCRFTNEADFVRKMGGEVWRVERYVRDLRFKNRRRPFDNKLSEEQKAHPSETQLDTYGFDRVLRACNMEELFSRVQGEIARLKSQNKL